VEEVALTSEVHGDSGSLGRRNYLFVTHRTARLHYGSNTCINQNLQAVGKWEECI
jgi:hypothetical protein